MKESEKYWYLYMVRCADDSIYTGISNDVQSRINKHNRGVGAKYTAGRLPVSLIFSERHANQSSARKREVQLKKWSKNKKEILSQGFPRQGSG